MLNRRLEFTNAATGTRHVIRLEVNEDATCVEMTYLEGSTGIAGGMRVLKWWFVYEAPIPGGDPGQVRFGNPRIEVEVPELRGMRLGTLAMHLLVTSIRMQPVVPVDPILLSAEDAMDERSKTIRNRFWERLGFAFDYKEDGLYGEARSMASDGLVAPEFKPPVGWEVVDLDEE